MNNGTATVAPVSTVAGLVPPVDRSPCRPGSVYVISRITLVGSSTYSGTPSCSATVASASGSRYLAASPTVPAGTWIWSKDSRSMNTNSSPSAYRYCMVRLSTVAVSTLVPALKVLSTTLPESTFFSVVRTNAPPLPGLTCWNSTTVHNSPSRLRTNPFLRSFVVAMSCPAQRSTGGLTGQVYRRVGSMAHRRPVHRHDTRNTRLRHPALAACQRGDPRPAPLPGSRAGRHGRPGPGRADRRRPAQRSPVLPVARAAARFRAGRRRYRGRRGRAGRPDRRVAAAAPAGVRAATGRPYRPAVVGRAAGPRAADVQPGRVQLSRAGRAGRAGTGRVHGRSGGAGRGSAGGPGTPAVVADPGAVRAGVPRPGRLRGRGHRGAPGGRGPGYAAGGPAVGGRARGRGTEVGAPVPGGSRAGGLARRTQSAGAGPRGGRRTQRCPDDRAAGDRSAPGLRPPQRPVRAVLADGRRGRGGHPGRAGQGAGRAGPGLPRAALGGADRRAVAAAAGDRRDRRDHRGDGRGRHRRYGPGAGLGRRAQDPGDRAQRPVGEH